MRCIDASTGETYLSVFEALDLPNADAEMARCVLVSKLLHSGDDRGLSNKELARLAGCPAKRIAQLRAIEYDDVTIDELCRYLVALGYDIRIEVVPKLGGDGHLSVVN